MAAIAKPPTAARRSGRPLLTLRELLGEVSRGPTRFELVCWRLNIEESRARPAWDVALRIKLLDAMGVDWLTGTELFALTGRGRQALRQLNGRGDRSASRPSEAPGQIPPLVTGRAQIGRAHV